MTPYSIANLFAWMCEFMGGANTARTHPLSWQAASCVLIPFKMAVFLAKTPARGDLWWSSVRFETGGAE